MTRSATPVLLVLAAVFFSACSSHVNPVQPPLSGQQQTPAVQEIPKAFQADTVADPVTPEEGPSPNATAGPTVYINDVSANLWRVTLGTNALRFVGSEGALLTDIAFDPKNHALYGIDFNSFYRINTSTGYATWIGYHGVPGGNALVFDANGKGYIEGYQQAELYGITNVLTGRATPIGPTGAYKSAGDLTFYNGSLVLSGFTGNFSTSTPDSLVTINPGNGAVLHVVPTRVQVLYGLASTGTNQLYGFANTSLYRMNPSAPLIQNRAVLIKNLAGSGLRQIYGAAYNGNYQI